MLIALRRRWPWAVAAAACYAIIVSPVLGLVQVGPQVAADRYTYLATLPFAVLAAGGLDAARTRAGATTVLLAVAAPGLGEPARAR